MHLFVKPQKSSSAKTYEGNANLTIYNKPKILTIDLNDEVIDQLKQEGFNIEVGTFGKNYSVQEGDECGLNGSLPYILEKDIVIVDLNRDENIIGENPYNNDVMQKANRTVYVAERGQNYFNPAYLNARVYLDEFKKIIGKGGIIITFSSRPDDEIYNLVTIERNYVAKKNHFSIDNYDWLPTKFQIEVCCLGREVIIDDDFSVLAESIIQGCKNEIEYKCIFPDLVSNSYTGVLFRNSIGEPIGFLRSEQNDDNIGYYFVLPQFKDKYKVIRNLFHDVIPNLKPDLFPDFVKNNWLDNEAYIFPKIKEIISQRDKLIEEYESKLKLTESEIEQAKEEYSFLTNILISQGFDEFLVDNVMKVLNFIGYKEIVKVDEIIEGNKQEDLRITDNKRFIVVEVKGHNGNPTEDDCQAILKYINRNMKKEGRTDIHGILIENHQKHLEPMQRNNPAYTAEQIRDALRDKYTLVDTWQLFQAARLLQEGLISFEEIDNELCKPGLFNAIPSKWNYLGKIDNYFNQIQVVGMILEAEELNRYDEIIVQNGNDYFKQIIDSIRIDDSEVEHAKQGDAISFKVERPISKQAKIYVIR
jgi:hypothetical protein